MAQTIKVGDEIIVVYPQRLALPTKGLIIAITNTHGKILGVQFPEPIGRHSCDGRGPDKHCLWIHPDLMLPLDRGEQLLKEIEAAKAALVDPPKLGLEIDDKGTKRLVSLE